LLNTAKLWWFACVTNPLSKPRWALNQSDEDLVDNIQAILRVLEGKLKRGLKNIDVVFIKASMGEPVKIKA
jgi:hypothetical protein